jgi:hypothetical protein
MRESREHFDGLARLHRTEDKEERRAVFRTSFANLGAAASEYRPVPLEGLDPAALRDSTKVALADGLMDDLAWLSPPHRAAAIYELAAALPPCDEKRELGRRVLTTLQEGDAQTFVTVATQLATGSRRGLSGAGIRARLALALDLPIGTGVRADALALALISRPDLAEEWLTHPSTGSLPSRRLSARLLERAARECARRAADGDDGIVAVFDRASVRAAWDRLLRDREPLVWRHVATARGLLAGIVTRFDAEIVDGLRPDLSPTEWRRAAASIASSIAVDPKIARDRCQKILDSDIFKNDRGIASSMILGLSRAAEAEPDAAEDLLVALVRIGGLDAVEALVELTQERLGNDFGDWAARLAVTRLADPEVRGREEDDGRDALCSALERELKPPEELTGDPTLRELLDDARDTFASGNARAAYGKAVAIVALLDKHMTRLEKARESTTEGRIEAFRVLRELDLSLLETSALSDLLHLGLETGKKGAVPAGLAALATIFDRLTQWLLMREREPVFPGETVAHKTLRLRRFRALLHCVDADGTFGDEKGGAELRERRLRAARILLARTRDDAPSPLRRIVHAAAARSCEALLREDVVEISDVLIAVVSHLSSEIDLSTFAEASMVPEVENVFRAYASLVERTERAARMTGARTRASMDALRLLTKNLPAASGPRVEALRGTLLRLASALEAIGSANSIAELAGELDDAGSRIATLAESAEKLARLVDGARRRLGEQRPDEAPACAAALRLVDMAALHTLRGNEGAYGDAIAGAIDALREELPTHIAEVAANVLATTVGYPHQAPLRTAESIVPLLKRRTAPLPPWLPPSRTLGGFYVLRALGAGAVGSVFIARRAEEKGDDKAQRFALKVPEYGGQAARTLSEEQFLQLFRDEAGALLAIPQHNNLARLVTFDAGAKPKPILVMELVDGPTLERLIETSGLDMARALSVLSGVAAGLGAMHDIGVGHLDLKPSNVILRDPDGPGPALETPVLVDFGLAGRKVRPGCATANYGAPEVWGLLPKGAAPSPAATDVYAFGCMMYEALTGRELFDGDSEVGILTAHLSHDGDLPQLDALSMDEELIGIIDGIRSCLRQDPRKRATIAEVNKRIESSASTLLKMRWPLTAN